MGQKWSKILPPRSEMVTKGVTDLLSQCISPSNGHFEKSQWRKVTRGARDGPAPSRTRCTRVLPAGTGPASEINRTKLDEEEGGEGGS